MRVGNKLKTRRILSKSLKIILKSLGGVFLLLYILVALLNSSLVQSFTAAKLAEYFSKEWKTKLSIGGLEIRPLLTVSLKDVYLETPEGKLVGDIGFVRASLRSFTLPSRFGVSSVELRDATYVVATQNGKINLAFIIDYFKSDKPKEPKPKKEPFVLEVDRLKMKNVNFHLDLYDNPTPVPEFGVAVNHMNFKNINALIEDIEVIGDSIVADFRRFETWERSGQRIKDLSGGFVVSPSGIRCHNLHLKTDDSDLNLQAEIQTSDWKTYSHFIDSAYCRLTVGKSSVVSMKDATYWAPMLKGFDQTVNLYTKIEGTVADARCEFLQMQTSNTTLSLSGSVKGLPNIDSTVFDVALYDLKTSAPDFNSFEMGEMLSMVKLPSMLDGLGEVQMTANFNGLIDCFTADAQIATEIGDVNLVAHSNKDPKTAKTSYDCALQSDEFNLGGLLGFDMLGSTALDINAMAVPAGLNELIASVEGDLRNLNFNGNRYNSVGLNAKMEKGEVKAELAIIDEAVVMNLDCEGDLLNEQTARLYVDINDANLQKINFFTFSDTTAEVSTSLYARVHKFNLDSMNAFVDFKDTKIKTSDTLLGIEYLNLRVRNDSAGNHIRFKSDLVDANVNGKYQIIGLADDVSRLVSHFMPDLSLISSSAVATPRTDSVYLPLNVSSQADFDVKVKDIGTISRLFDLDMALYGPLDLVGKLNPRDILSAELNCEAFGLGGIRFEGIGLSTQADSSLFTLMVGLERLQLSDSFAIETPKVSVKLSDNELGVLATFGNDSKETIGGRLDLQTYLTNTGLQASFNDSYVSLAGDRIGFNDNHLINYYDGRLGLMNFALVKGKENIVINGEVSDRAEDKLSVTFKNLDIADFNPILGKMGLNLQGEMNDRVVLRSVLKDMTLTSNIRIDDLVINGVNLGNAKIGVNNMGSPKDFAADISMVYSPQGAKQRIPLSIKGRVSPYEKEDNLDLKVKMEEFDLRLIESYLSSFTSYLRGSLSTEELAVRGKFTQPHILGSLQFKDAAMQIDMLNTVYSINDRLYVEDNVISLRDFVLKDVEKNKITINGTVTHENFSNFALNLKAKADKLKILDTDQSPDQMYYGTAYASADVNLTGDLSFLNIEVAATTERGTSLTVPISSKISANESSYITFASKQEIQTAKQISKTPKEESGLGYRVVVDLNVNPIAEILVPLDFNLLKGDLSAAGRGDLRIEVSSESDVSMLGTVTVDNGLFKMSLMDMMTKAFVIEQGGTLAWSGAPSDGVIDLQAIYKTKASLAPLLGPEFSKAVDVQSVIHLSGNLTNPQPKFDIRLPNTDANTVERVFMNIDRNDERAMLEQTASLLFIHQFYSSEGAAENSIVETGLSSAFEAAFGQISGMLTDIIRVVDVDMNYSRGADASSDRVDFNVSKDYGKIVVNANAGFSGRNETETAQADAIIGDAYVEYKMTDNFRLRVFNRSNADDFTKYNIAPYTQGVGLFYQRQYDKFKDIFIRKRKQENKDTE